MDQVNIVITIILFAIAGCIAWATISAATSTRDNIVSPDEWWEHSEEGGNIEETEGNNKDS